MICGLYFAMPLTFKYLYETMTSSWWQSGTIYFFVKRDNLFRASINFPDKCSSFHSLLQCDCLVNFHNKLIASFRQCSLFFSQNLVAR